MKSNFCSIFGIGELVDVVVVLVYSLHPIKNESKTEYNTYESKYLNIYIYISRFIVLRYIISGFRFGFYGTEEVSI